jgi:hypothetical protein
MHRFSFGICKFEEAQKIKEKIEILENYQSRSTILKS